MAEWVEARLEGLNLDRALKKLWRAEVPVFRAERTSFRVLEVKVGCNREKLVALFDKSCYNITIMGERGPRPFFRKAAGRLGFWVGLLICLPLLFFCSGRIWSVEVEGLERVDAAAFGAALTEAGVSVGRPCGFDADGVQRTLTAAFDEISLVTLARRGTAVRVLVVEREEQSVLRSEAGDLLAAADGVVIGVVVYSGTAAVKPGDRVRAGQVLIEGRLYRPDQSFDEVPAAGEVYGLTEVVREEVFNGLTVQPYRTGRQVTKTSLSLFGQNFPVLAEPDPGDFACYERTVSRRWLFPGLILPVRLCRITLHEIAFAEVYEDFEKVRKVLLEEAETRTREEAGQLGEVQSLVTEVLEEGGGKRIRVTATVKFSLLTPPQIS